jgi:hypothetical protein
MGLNQESVNWGWNEIRGLNQERDLLALPREERALACFLLRLHGRGRVGRVPVEPCSVQGSGFKGWGLVFRF